MMRGNKVLRPSGRLTRCARWLGLDRNPLRRTTDRIEAAIRLAMIILLVGAVPMAAVAVGQRADQLAIRHAHAQQVGDHLVNAVLVRQAPATGVPDPYTSIQYTWVLARWQPPGRRPGSGRSWPQPDRAAEAPWRPGSTPPARSPIPRQNTVRLSAMSASPSRRPASCQCWCCWGRLRSPAGPWTVGGWTPGRPSGGRAVRSVPADKPDPWRERRIGPWVRCGRDEGQACSGVPPRARSLGDLGPIVMTKVASCRAIWP